MFTGIIEELGTVTSFTSRTGGGILSLSCREILPDRRPGSSIAVNGVCLTAVEVTSSGFRADLSDETLHRSNLSSLRPGDRVNLERPMALGGRLEGHLVTGHVDTVSRIRSLAPRGDFWELWVEYPRDQARLLVEKGSVAVDGISLTVAALDSTAFLAAIIPETRQRTNLADRKPGDRVNLEFDLIGKYVLRGLGAWNEPPKGVTIEVLQRTGFTQK